MGNGEGDIAKARAALVAQNPPILSFASRKEVDDFYENRKQEPQIICCNGQSCMDNKTETKLANPGQIPPLIASTGSGKLYMGKADEIVKEMKEDIQQQKFGSPEQNQILEGLRQISEALTKRDENHSLHSSKPGPDETAQKPLNPFDIKLKR